MPRLVLARFHPLVLALVACSLVGCGEPDAQDTPRTEAPGRRSEASPVPGPLAEALEAKAAASAARMPEDVGALFQRAAQELRASGLLEGMQRVGGTAPEFELKDPFGVPVSLAALRAKGPVVVAFHRGKW